MMMGNLQGSKIMKITRSYLRKLIKESYAVNHSDFFMMFNNIVNRLSEYFPAQKREYHKETVLVELKEIIYNMKNDFFVIEGRYPNKEELVGLQGDALNLLNEKFSVENIKNQLNLF